MNRSCSAREGAVHAEQLSTTLSFLSGQLSAKDGQMSAMNGLISAKDGQISAMIGILTTVNDQLATMRHRVDNLQEQRYDKFRLMKSYLAANNVRNLRGAMGMFLRVTLFNAFKPGGFGSLLR